MASNRKYQYLFGPVPSRRLGRSLGVDLVPAKTCSMDCVYCESGGTTDFTVERKEYFPTFDIIKELDVFLADDPELDFITFSGAGEPTLHSGIGKILQHIKTKFPAYKTALLTNAMMLTDPKVFAEVKSVDLIVPSLDAVAPEIFSVINRPAIDIDCSELIDVLARFKEESAAEFWLEIFVVPGVNDTPLSIDLMAAAVERIKPDKVQLNTLDRPGVENWVKPASRKKMEFFGEKIAKYADVQIIGRFEEKGCTKSVELTSEEIISKVLDLISRRPCTADDLASSMNCKVTEITGVLANLEKQGKICSEERERGFFYKIS